LGSLLFNLKIKVFLRLSDRWAKIAVILAET